MDRKSIEQITIEKAIVDVKRKLASRLIVKGRGSMASSHEILGIIQEEYHEFIHAVEENSIEDIRSELLDIAVGCVFGIACIDDNGVDW